MVVDPNVQQRDIEYLSKAVDDMTRALARLEGKIDGMSQSYSRKEEVDKEFLRLEKEIEKLDLKQSLKNAELEQGINENTNWRWKMVGLGVGATLLIPLLTSLVLRAI